MTPLGIEITIFGPYTEPLIIKTSGPTLSCIISALICYITRRYSDPTDDNCFTKVLPDFQ